MLRLVAAIAALFAATPAFAHHAMDGQTPNTLATGLISGLAHPVIGLDHLAFILAAGLLAAPRARGLVLPLAFVLASLAGVVVHLNGVDLPAGEILVAGSVLLLGILLVIPRRIDDSLFAAILALAGLFHGYAFGESIVGAETTPLGAYVAGLAIIQYGIAAGVVLAWRFLGRSASDRLPQLSRFAGAGVAVIGAVFLVLNLAA
ncbi:HupE/UreJ family protein [Ferrovibrio sp.]|uniref:HupE/UreJ family protein n=1 Tax=Ferrovibrio sp. TaxID=1917215 RepID=UPI0026042770|nr:HupE/UreJ family protein [Ferrovibrio sp.]